MTEYDDINDSYDQEEEDFTDDNREKYLIFKISNELYGFSIGIIKEIITMQPITEIPEMPQYIKGVINLRGKIIPAIDLRSRFKMPLIKYEDTTCIVIIKSNEFLIGLIVDYVQEVIKIPANDIEATLASTKNYHQQFIKGLGKKDSNIYILLDENKILYEEDVNHLSNIFKEEC